MIPSYIAGPFRHHTSWGIAQNVHRAETIHLAACRLGLASICPHTNTSHFQGECSDRFWLEMTLEILRTVACRGGILICVPGGWRTSSGTRGEMHEAQRIGMRRFEAVEISDDPDVLRQAVCIAHAGKDANGDETWSGGFGELPGMTLGEWMEARRG